METPANDFTMLMRVLVILFIFGVVSEMDYRDKANTPNYVANFCAGTWEDYRESKPDCQR